jgi:hypothetical protein
MDERMKVAKGFLTVALTAVCVLAAAKLVLPRVRCNLEAGRINAELRALRNNPVERARYTRAQSNIVICEKCMAQFPDDYKYIMLQAANHDILDHREDALRLYRRALEIEQRPEIYAYIGSLQIERGDVAAGRATLLHAATFNLNVTLVVDEPLRSEIHRAVMARHEALRQRATK